MPSRDRVGSFVCGSRNSEGGSKSFSFYSVVTLDDH